MKKIESAVRRAINEFNMIENGDSVAVGVSGGKDSLVLLTALANMQKYLPQKFELKALTLDLGFKDGTGTSEIAAYCARIGVEYIVKQTDIGEVVFDIRKETNPCSLCAKMRRGALYELAVEHGCNKVALGHHYDDVIETFFLSLFYEGRISCFDAKTFLDRTGVTVIRPLLLIEEKAIRGVAKSLNLPVMHNPCPADHHTRREYIKNLLYDLEKENRDLKKHIFMAVKRGLLDKVE